MACMSVDSRAPYTYIKRLKELLIDLPFKMSCRFNMCMSILGIRIVGEPHLHFVISIAMACELHCTTKTFLRDTHPQTRARIAMVPSNAITMESQMSAALIKQSSRPTNPYLAMPPTTTTQASVCCEHFQDHQLLLPET